MGLAEVVSVETDSIAIRLTDGSLAGQMATAATGPDTEYAPGGQRCVAPELSAETIAVLLIRGDDDSYSARDVDLFQA